MILIGESIVAGLSRYPTFWKKYLQPLNSINLGISGDRIENVLWRSTNLAIPSSVSKVVVICSTNNLLDDTSYDIADGITDIGLSFTKNRPRLKKFICGLLPRDQSWSVNRLYVKEINDKLKLQCIKHQFTYIDQDKGWILKDDNLDPSLYYRDNLHLVENGNSKLANSISNKL